MDCWIFDWNDRVMESDPELHAETANAPTKPKDTEAMMRRFIFRS